MITLNPLQSSKSSRNINNNNNNNSRTNNNSVKAFDNSNADHINDKRNLLKYLREEKLNEFKELISKYDTSILNVEIDNDKNTLLHEAACLNRNDKFFQILLTDNQDINNKQNVNGLHALSLATKKCNINAIDLILKQSDKSSVFIKDNDGNNILAIATLYDFTGKCLEKLLSFILEKNRDKIKEILDNQNKKKETVFHIVAANNNIKCLKVLMNNKLNIKRSLEIDIDINLQDEDNDMPIGLAVQRNHYECVKEFLECDDINIKKLDNSKNSVFHYSALNGNLSILKLLFKHLKSMIEKVIQLLLLHIIIYYHYYLLYHQG